MAVIGEMRVNIVAATEGLQRGIAQARSQIGSFAGSLGSAKIGLNALGAGVAGVAAGFAALARGVVENVRSFDELNDTAARLNSSYSGLATLKTAAQLTGTEFDSLTGALGLLRKRLAEAATTGKGDTAEALKTLGLQARELAGMGTDEAFGTIAGALKKVADETDRTALSYSLFGKQAGAIRNTLDIGALGLERMRVETERLGLAINDSDADKLARLNDELDRLKMAKTGAWNEISIAVAPASIAVLERFTAAIQAVRDPGGTDPAARIDVMKGSFAGTAYNKLASLGGPTNPFWWANRVMENSARIGLGADSPAAVQNEHMARGVLLRQGILAGNVRQSEIASQAIPAIGRVFGEYFSKAIKPNIDMAGKAIIGGADAIGGADKAAARKLFLWQLFNPMSGGQPQPAAAASGAVQIGINRALDATTQEGLLAMRNTPATTELKKVAEHTEKMAGLLGEIADNTRSLEEMLDLEGFTISGG